MVSIELQGGLCNQMFMIAFIHFYAKKHGLNYIIPTKVTNPHISNKPAYTFPGIPYSDQFANHRTRYKERSFEYHEIDKYDHVLFEGYFQSHKYFDEKEVIELFNFPWEDITDTCAIHVRRDDYLKWSEYHPPITKEYIVFAMDFMAAFFNITKFKFFSDDLQWCMSNFFNQFGSYEISYSHEQDELKDLISLSNHQFLIGSNSTFPLWGHYLNRNENKFAIFPERWFGPKINHNTKDLYPPKSIQI